MKRSKQLRKALNGWGRAVGAPPREPRLFLVPPSPAPPKRARSRQRFDRPAFKFVADKKGEPVRMKKRCPACEARMVHEGTRRRWLCIGCGAHGDQWGEGKTLELVVRESPSFFDVAKRDPEQQKVLAQIRKDRRKAERDVREARK